MLFDFSSFKSADNFKDFIHSENQASVIKAIEEVATNNSSAYIWGISGVGKSHLLNASINLNLNNQQQLLSLGNEIAESGLLIQDDLQNLNAEEQQYLFNFLTKLHQMENPKLHILCAGNVPSAKLNLREDLRTRIEALPSFHITKLTDEELIDAIINHAYRMKRELPKEVAVILVQLFPRNMNKLVSVLNELDEYAIKHNVKITTTLVRKWLQNENENRQTSIFK